MTKVVTSKQSQLLVKSGRAAKFVTKFGKRLHEFQ